MPRSSLHLYARIMGVAVVVCAVLVATTQQSQDAAWACWHSLKIWSNHSLASGLRMQGVTIQATRDDISVLRSVLDRL